MTQAPKRKSPWISPSSLPQPLATEHFVLEPLAAEHAELDFDALMSCRTRLREELQWGDWPSEGFTLELNREDLDGHYGEFIRGEAFAYTVLRPDRGRCLGCIYIEHCLAAKGAQLAFWVVDDAVDVEEFLVTSVLEWIHDAWSIDRVVIPLRETNARGITIAERHGLAAWDSAKDDSLSNHRCFLSVS